MVLQRNNRINGDTEIWRDLSFKLAWFLRLRSPTICCLQTVEPEKLMVEVPVRVQRPKIQEHWCLRTGENGCFRSTREQLNLPSMYFVLFVWCPTDLMMPSCVGRHALYSVKCLSLSEAPAQTHPEIIFYHLSGYPSLSPVKLTQN